MSQDPAPAQEVLRAAALEVRPDEFSVYAAGSFVQMSRREFGVLVALMRHPGRIISREQLYSLVWEAEMKHRDRSVDVYVHKVRTKLEGVLPDWTFIHTHFSYGYRFHPEPAPASSARG